MFNVNLNWKVKEIIDKATNVLYNYTEQEAKVREATNDEPWGPHSSLMQEISQATFSYESFPEVMGMLWRRLLEDNKRVWRRVYKGLLLLDYLVKNGSERVVTSAREHIYDLRGLENYTFVDEMGKDQGVNVRNRVKDLIEMIMDDDRLRNERKKAKKSKDKYIGLSGESMGFASRRDADFSDFPSERRNQRRGSFGDSNDEDSDRENKRGFRDSPSPPQRKENAFEDDDAAPAPKPTTGHHNFDNKPRKSVPSKMIDLGAAATFAAEAKQTQSKPTPETAAPKSADLLDGFGDFGSSSTPSSANGDFADFSQFQNAPSVRAAPATSGTGLSSATDDDFADFASFDSNAPPSKQYNSLPIQTSSTINNNSSALPEDLFGGPPLSLPPVQPSTFSSVSPPGVMNVMSPVLPTTMPAMGASPLLPTMTPNQSSLGAQTPAQTPGALGSTWTGLNISVDNLLSPKQQAPRPTMNQLASNVQSLTLGNTGHPIASYGQNQNNNLSPTNNNAFDLLS
ncbi:clathrin interactor 1 [Galendromus occidentalis]|uniref:Clathrin interactor 1 n=1 Tax=Galendromus occidentalis TaxID=34638 RepID=A0AAJ6QZ30_9ACAR|nr:clathrin interactor 1 [Galendromus occidentalis]